RRLKRFQVGPDVAAKEIVAPERSIARFRSKHPRIRAGIYARVQPFGKHRGCSRRDGDETRLAILGPVNIAAIDPLFDLHGASVLRNMAALKCQNFSWTQPRKN